MAQIGRSRSRVTIFANISSLGRGQAVIGRPARRDGPSGGVRLATTRSPVRRAAQPLPPGLGLLRSPSPQAEGERTGEAAAEPGLERGEAEQTADDEDGDQHGMGGAEEARDEGVPGDIGGVVFLAQWRNEVPAVDEEGAEEVEDLGEASGVEARGYGPIGIGVCWSGWGDGGVGHESVRARNGNTGQEVFRM